MVTAYPYPVGKNPQFDAFKAKFDYSKSNLEADAAQRRTKAQEDYQAALASLDERGTYSRRNLDTSLISRGVFHSGEANRKRAELESSLLGGRSAADLAYQNALGSVSADLQRAMNGLNIDWEQAIAGTKSGGGGGGSGSVTSLPSPTLPYMTPAGMPVGAHGGWSGGAPPVKPKRSSGGGLLRFS